MRWAKWPQERLLDLRLCDLNVRIKGTALETRIKRVLAELKQKGLRFRPHFWVSDDWFTPERVPGCAVPFYLLHPRLTRLERHEMLEVEGADRVECMKILRHEVGHAIEHAYKLHLRRRRQRLFGKTTKRYPARYMPKPRSRKFVQHLDYWYAQAHPDEDFAETFAVWLNPRSNWRKRYAGWGALGKLEYMDKLMREIADKPPLVKSRARVEPLRAIKKTLRRHYADRQKRYGAEYPDFLDSDLRRLFSNADEFARNETAAAFLRRARGEIRRMVSRWTGYNQYSLDSLLRDVIGRCGELELRLTAPPDRTKIDVVIMLTVNTMEFLYTGRRWISL
ncbi:MAG: putative zinc-binding metallopeptidase [Planctomycetota bacterium]|jgi:hypothetical protein